ncbi:MAG: signal peptidase [Verrucomicrobiales bacterium]|nr:signal peptidase [Verrucomicrobiales bacterium]
MEGDFSTEAVPQPEVKPSWWKHAFFGRYPEKTLIRLLFLIFLNLLLFKSLLVPIRVTGDSMEPTYADGSINFVNKWAYLNSPPQRGDVVAIRSGAGKKTLLIKRIVGLPGETISNAPSTAEGSISVNGQVLVEPYIYSRLQWSINVNKLRLNEYFYIGDNRLVSVFGRVQKSDIVGKVVFETTLKKPALKKPLP